MNISILGVSPNDASYAISTNNRIIKLQNNYKIDIDINKYSYIKILFDTDLKNKHISNFIEFYIDNNHYPILINPSWNSYIQNNRLYSENIFVNLKDYTFQHIDPIDKINQLNCLCSDFTRPYFFPDIKIKIANSYNFIFNNWTGNNQVWLSKHNTSCGCLLLGKNKCFFTCSLSLPSECGQTKYEFFSVCEHNTPYDELGRLDCFSLVPTFTELQPINFPMLTDELCNIDLNNFKNEIQITTEYASNV